MSSVCPGLEPGQRGRGRDRGQRPSHLAERTRTLMRLPSPFDMPRRGHSFPTHGVSRPPDLPIRAPNEMNREAGMDDTGDSGSASESPSSRPDWRPGELELRSQEVATQTRGSRVQTWTTLAALVAAGVAIFAAVDAPRSIQVAADGVRRQADESRLTTSVDNLGADLPAQRVAGFTLLRRHALQRLESAASNAAPTSLRTRRRLPQGSGGHQ
jgi:hypothetical protein